MSRTRSKDAVFPYRKTLFSYRSSHTFYQIAWLNCKVVTDVCEMLSAVNCTALGGRGILPIPGCMGQFWASKLIASTIMRLLAKDTQADVKADSNYR